jgi:methionine synthase I (cobalamin-dependent)
MIKLRITDLLKTGRVLVSDGAWGTFLYRKGLKPEACLNEWSLTHPDEVEDSARSYIRAGADVFPETPAMMATLTPGLAGCRCAHHRRMLRHHPSAHRGY